MTSKEDARSASAIGLRSVANPLATPIVLLPFGIAAVVGLSDSLLDYLAANYRKTDEVPEIWTLRE